VKVTFLLRSHLVIYYAAYTQVKSFTVTMANCKCGKVTYHCIFTDITCADLTYV